MNLPTAIRRRSWARIEHKKPHSAWGFSILELLVVIAILVIVMGIAVITLRSVGGRPAKAMELVANMVAVAREEAISTGAPTRVAVCVDPAAGVKYLRFVTTLVDADGNPATVGWKFSVRGQPFPQGTIFWPEFSTPADAGNTMKLNLSTPGAVQDGTSGSAFVFIEFDAAGYPTKSGVQWVFTKALMDDSGGAPTVPQPMDRNGFILYQTGRLAYFQSASDITQP